MVVVGCSWRCSRRVLAQTSRSLSTVARTGGTLEPKKQGTTSSSTNKAQQQQQQSIGSRAAARMEASLEEWLPPAYRSPDSSSSSSSYKKNYVKKQSAAPYKQQRHLAPRSSSSSKPTKLKYRVAKLKEHAQQKELAETRVARTKVQNDLDRLGVLSGELRRILSKYRHTLENTTDTVPATDNDENNDSNEESKFKLSVDQSLEVREKKIARFIKKLNVDVEALQALNQDDKPALHPKLLIESDDIFRGLSRVLIDIVEASCKCYKQKLVHENVALIAYAEATFMALANLRAQREELFEKLHPSTPESSKAEEASTRPPEIKLGWGLSQVVSYIRSSIATLADNNSSQTVDEPLLAHQDPDLALSQQSLRLIVESIATAANQGLLENTTERVVNLLKMLPEGTVPESRTLLSIMEILCHVGTLEAAQECQRLFDSYSTSISHLPFTLVLQGYLEASRKETIHERKQEIVQRVLDAVEERWSTHFPRHLGERIAQGASVLHCIAVSGTSKDPKIKQAADEIVQRLIGEDSYDAFAKAATTSLSGTVDAMNVPLVNFWARVYATSGDIRNIKLAKTMVQNILPNEMDGVSQTQYIKYPNVETVNAILDGVRKLHQEGRTDLDEGTDLVFCESLLDFSMSRRESGVWPDLETFEIIMDLYTTLKPHNVGQRMEQLISHYETRAYLSQNSTMKISLATYNRVIWGLWEEAKRQHPRRAAQRALALLDKLEMLSTPLLLTRKQVLNMRGIELYRLDLHPTAKTYEMVLNVCADTAAPSEFESAAKVANIVGNRMLGLKTDFKQRSVDLVQSCIDRLEPNSDLIKPMEELVTRLKEKLE